jgi:hypothetical protein
VGFYVRKSLRAGPFRFNLSGSGLGVSVGVPGFRVGSGPRGNYVYVGAAGRYYRATRTPGPAPAQLLPPMPPASGVLLEDITGASVQELVAASPSELVTQLQAASRRWMIWPFALAALLLLALPLGGVGLVLLLLGAPAVYWLSLRDRARRSVIVMYDVNDDPARRFGEIVAAVAAIERAQRVWFVDAAGMVATTYQYKVNAGASTLISRANGTAGMNGPRVLVTNIVVPTLACGRRSIHFLPDRVLIRDGSDFADLPYEALLATAEPFRFIESGPVPSDSRQVDTTWRYVNVRGGPDRRFKDNRRLPVMLYGRLSLSDQRGLRSVWDTSRAEAVTGLADALRRAAMAGSPPLRH